MRQIRKDLNSAIVHTSSYVPPKEITLLHTTQGNSKGGICHGGHFAITYGGRVIVPPDLSLLSPPSNFIQGVLALSLGLISHTHLDYCVLNMRQQ